MQIMKLLLLYLKRKVTIMWKRRQTTTSLLAFQKKLQSDEESTVDEISETCETFSESTTAPSFSNITGIYKS